MEEISWLGPEEMRAWRTLVGATSRLMATLDLELQADCGLALADYEVLVFLSESPERRARMSELAEALHLSPSGLTRRVDRLARGGLVARERCPSDRRGSFAVLTPAGLDRLVGAAPNHLRHVREHFVDRFEPERLAALADSLELVMGACPARGRHTAADAGFGAIRPLTPDWPAGHGKLGVNPLLPKADEDGARPAPLGTPSPTAPTSNEVPPVMPTSTSTHDAIGELLGSVNGKLIDRARVVDALLDLRLLATGEPIVVGAIDALLGNVPGRSLVEAEWYVDALSSLSELDSEDLATN